MTGGGPAGPPLLALSLAGQSFLLHGDDVRWRDVLAPRYAPFRGEGDAPFEVELVASAEPPRDWHEIEPLLEPPASTTRGATIDVGTAAFHIALDAGARRARVEAPLHRAAVDVLLRHALPLLLAPDGLVLHGALLADGGAAWICCGPSGCGKSTLAGLLAERAYCDELCGVRRETGAWKAWSLPYWHGRPAAVALRGLYLLRHGAQHRRLRLRPAEALRRLLREVRWPLLGEAAGAALANLAALVREVPVWELAFLPQADVWDTIAAGEEVGA
jgi:hypothetical protein